LCEDVERGGEPAAVIVKSTLNPEFKTSHLALIADTLSAAARQASERDR
jgi:hypothetical protein